MGRGGAIPARTPVGPITVAMPSDIRTILSLEVPVVVRLGERTLQLQDVIRLVPGSIIELPKAADEELDLLVNNKQIGSGTAVKVGENFGLRITYIGDMKDRVRAMGGQEMARGEA
jgi:flagellar motor switch protein FliN/FliY